MSEQKISKNPLYEAWSNHPTRRSELAELLRDPAMIDALNILRSKIFESRPLLPGTPNPIEWAALHGQRREGGLDILTNFLQLAVIRPLRLPEKKEWETADRDAALHQMAEELPGTAVPAEISPTPPENPQPS